MGLTPAFTLTANRKEVTSQIAIRQSSLRVTFNSEPQSDELEIILADTDPAWPIIRPPVGAVLSLSLGYDSDLVRQGDYIVSSLSGRGGQNQGQIFSIRGRAAPYTGTPDGMTGFQTQKTRSWRAGTTIGAMVSKMASEHGMTAAVSPSLAHIQLQHYDQADESDISFLVRLARHYDAVAKPAGSKLLFVARGTSTSASGQALPVVPVTPGMVSHWSWDEDRHITPGTVVALYHASRQAQTFAVSIGSGDPVRRIKRKFRTSADARAAAMAEMARRARSALRLQLSMPGNATISAETTLRLDKNFRQGIDGLWLVRRGSHTLETYGGFITEIECERPNDDPAVAAYLSSTITNDAVKPR